MPVPVFSKTDSTWIMTLALVCRPTTKICWSNSDFSLGFRWTLVNLFWFFRGPPSRLTGAAGCRAGSGFCSMRLLGKHFRVFESRPSRPRGWSVIFWFGNGKTWHFGSCTMLFESSEMVPEGDTTWYFTPCDLGQTRRSRPQITGIQQTLKRVAV